jgi:flagellar protein FliO/FliZ
VNGFHHLRTAEAAVGKLKPLLLLVASAMAFSCAALPAAAAAAATGLSTNLLTMTPPPVPEAGFSLLRVLGALTLVLTLFLAGVWVYRNWHRVAVNRGTQQLRILESRSLGGRHALHVVGYHDQRLLLASSPNGISLISHLPAGELNATPATPAAAAPGNFVHALQQAIQQKP